MDQHIQLAEGHSRNMNFNLRPTAQCSFEVTHKKRTEDHPVGNANLKISVGEKIIIYIICVFKLSIIFQPVI